MDKNLDVISTSFTDFNGVEVSRDPRDLLALYFALAKYDEDYHGESFQE